MTKVQPIVSTSDLEDKDCKLKMTNNKKKLKNKKLPNGQKTTKNGGKHKISLKQGKHKMDLMENKCKICGKVFGKRKPLRQHMMVMHGKADFKCPTCDSSFKHHDHLKRHMAKHVINLRKSRQQSKTKIASKDDYEKVTNLTPVGANNNADMTDNMESTVGDSEPDTNSSWSTNLDKTINMEQGQRHENDIETINTVLELKRYSKKML